MMIAANHQYRDLSSDIISGTSMYAYRTSIRIVGQFVFVRHRINNIDIDMNRRVVRFVPIMIGVYMLNFHLASIQDCPTVDLHK